MTTPLGACLEEVRSEFPAWAVFRSDEGAFYATRRGVILTSEQLSSGIHQTVVAENLPTLIERLREQAMLK